MPPCIVFQIFIFLGPWRMPWCKAKTLPSSGWLEPKRPQHCLQPELLGRCSLQPCRRGSLEMSSSSMLCNAVSVQICSGGPWSYLEFSPTASSFCSAAVMSQKNKWKSPLVPQLAEITVKIWKAFLNWGSAVEDCLLSA